MGFYLSLALTSSEILEVEIIKFDGGRHKHYRIDKVFLLATPPTLPSSLPGPDFLSVRKYLDISKLFTSHTNIYIIYSHSLD